MHKPRNKFFYLLIGLVSISVAAAIVPAVGVRAGDILIQIVMTATLLLGIWSLVAQRRWFYAGVLLAALDVLVTLGAIYFRHVVLVYVALGIELLFFAFSTGIVGRQVIAPGPVDSNRIFGAICIYLMVGYMWGGVYFAVELMLPGAFAGIHTDLPYGQRLAEVTYFSMVSITTLGYGDILPATSVTRVLAYLEAMFGQFYIAVLVAALVGLRIAGHQPEGSQGVDSDRGG